MISVNFLDQFAATAPPKSSVDQSARPAPNDRAFDRSLKDASEATAPTVPKAKKPEAKSEPPKEVDDQSDDAVATAADAASSTDAKSQTDATTNDDTQQTASDESTAAQTDDHSTVKSSTETQMADPAPAEPTSTQPQQAEASTTTTVTDVVAAVQVPQRTTDSSATAQPTQPSAPDTTQPNVVQATQIAEQTRSAPNTVSQEVAVPVQPAQVTARTDATASNVDDTDETPPGPTQPHRPVAEHDTTRLPLPGSAPSDDASLRDALTRHQVRQDQNEAAGSQRTEKVEAKTAPQSAPAHTSSGPSSPAAELAKALFPEARIGDLPAPASVGSEASHAASAAPATSHAPADPGAPTPPAAVIRGATIVDAHDSGAGFRLDSTSQSTAATPVDRLTNVLASSVSPRSSFIRLQLAPPDLGQLRIEVRMNHDALTVRMQAESTAVKGLIEDRMGELKSAMQQHGIRVDRVDVDVKPQAGSSNARGEHGDAGARQQTATWDAPRNSGDWGKSSGGSDESYGTETNVVDDAVAPSTADDIHFVTTESSVDVLI